MMMTMYDDFYEQSAWCYWVVSVATLLSFVGFIVACICSCRHGENKSEFLGLPGMVTITHADNDDYDGQPTLSDITPVVTQDTVDGGKRTSGANRSLPDIPKDRNVGTDGNGISSNPQDIIYEAAEIMNDSSELYATVRDKNSKRDNERGTRTSSQESSSLQEDDSVSPYARLNTLNSTPDEHPYAQVQSVQKSEVNRQNSFRNPSQMTDNVASTSNSQPTNPVAPPRTRRSSSHNSLLNTEVTTCDIQAANAITGGVQANQDLPYMTPPLLMPLPRPPQPQHNGPPQHFSGDSQDSNKGYTSISVREPLANIIAQTKAAHQNRQNSRPVQDSHYATVSDDSDEMYAAIDEQEKIYTSGSETYAQIQPMISEQSRVVGHGELPLLHQAPPRIIPEEPAVFSAPQPPSVDSLRHVAHAHSRQASSSSATSSIANPGSPKPEKRQANSPLPPPPPPLPAGSTEGTTDVYALIDKQHKKPDDHQAPLSHSCLVPGKSVEDMYAKVLKKKRESEEEHSGANVQANDVQIPGKKLNLVEISRASWSSHDSVEINKREPEIRAAVPPDILNLESSSIEFSVVARKYELDRVTPDHVFEPMSTITQRTINSVSEPNDPNYEMLRPPYSRAEDSKLTSQPSTSIRNGIDVLSFYSVPFKHRQVSNASSEDPGYEKVRLRRRADVDGDTDSEPNYESMPHDHGEPNYASVCRPGDSDTDPNYESVHHSDPNYESVRYMSVTKNSIADPPYEQVNSYSETGLNVDGYEKVKSKQNDDPNYEKIHNTLSRDKDHFNNTDNADPDDDQYVQV